MEHFYVKFGDPSCIVFKDVVWKNRQDTLTKNGCKNPTPVVSMGYNKEPISPTCLALNSSSLACCAKLYDECNYEFPQMYSSQQFDLTSSWATATIKISIYNAVTLYISYLKTHWPTCS